MKFINYYQLIKLCEGMMDTYTQLWNDDFIDEDTYHESQQRMIKLKSYLIKRAERELG